MPGQTRGVAGRDERPNRHDVKVVDGGVVAAVHAILSVLAGLVVVVVVERATGVFAVAAVLGVCALVANGVLLAPAMRAARAAVKRDGGRPVLCSR